MSVEYISFSAWKDFVFCPFKHKITKIDRVPQPQNEHKAFGKAIHGVIDKICKIELEKETLGFSREEDLFDPRKMFLSLFKEELLLCDEEAKKKLDPNLIREMKEQGPKFAPLILPALKESFGNFKIVSSEQEIRQNIDNFTTIDFYGILDLVIQTEDGKYHIIDWKTSGNGWRPEKKAETETTYQLTFYKYFFCKATGVEHENVETHFAILKRKPEKDKVEIFRVTSGPKKVGNALNVLNNAVVNITRSLETGKFVKNKLNCLKCEYHKTQWCT